MIDYPFGGPILVDSWVPQPHYHDFITEEFHNQLIKSLADMAVGWVIADLLYDKKKTFKLKRKRRHIRRRR